MKKRLFPILAGGADCGGDRPEPLAIGDTAPCWRPSRWPTFGPVRPAEPLRDASREPS